MTSLVVRAQGCVMYDGRIALHVGHVVGTAHVRVIAGVVAQHFCRPCRPDAAIVHCRAIRLSLTDGGDVVYGALRHL